jgi:hypothetical protein
LPALKHMNYEIYMKNLGKIKRHGLLKVFLWFTQKTIQEIFRKKEKVEVEREIALNFSKRHRET